jgi:hypothetical protein
MAALAAGALTKVSVSQYSDQLSSAAATGGTSPYTYQWYRNVSGTGVIGPAVSGATSLSLNDSSLIPGTVYYYHVLAIDSGLSVATSPVLSVTTLNPGVLNPNQFAEVPFLGMLDQRYNYNTKEAQVDSTQSGTIYAGQAMKFPSVPVNGGVMSLVACTSNTDACQGFIVYDIKNQGYQAAVAEPSYNFGSNSHFEIAQGGDVIYLYATGVITRGAEVCLDVSSPGGVQATGNSATVVGWAMDGASASGTLIRVELKTPSFATA